MRMRIPATKAMDKLLIAVIAFIGILLLCASAFCFWMFQEFFFRWDFNELGRHYDPETSVVYTDSGFFWIMPALFFLLASLVLLIALARWRRKRKAP